MAITKLGPKGGDDDEGRGLARMMGPAHADHMLRQTLQTIWMMLPPDRRKPSEVEREFARLSERVLRDFREDATAFGVED